MAAVGSKVSLALVGALALGLSMSACARHGADSDLAAGATAGGAGYGAAGPGSVQEFNQSVGDRVFFDTDQTDLSPTAQATLDKQAAWLNQYNRYSFTIEGHADERGTREYNSPLAPAAPRRCTTTSPPRASRPRACGRSATARSDRSRCATTSPAGRRTAAP